MAGFAIGLASDNGPQLILIQLLPSSTVAPAVRLKTGTGTFPSLVPGGTDSRTEQLPAASQVASGGLFEPLQYCWATPEPKVDVFASEARASSRIAGDAGQHRRLRSERESRVRVVSDRSSCRHAGRDPNSRAPVVTHSPCAGLIQRGTNATVACCAPPVGCVTRC